jgi:hypothetical protein
MHRGITITSRKNMYYDEGLSQMTCVSPQRYSPNSKSQTNGRYAKIGIGFGSKQWGLFGLQNPGVGQYNIPSSFDSSRKLKMPIN